MSAFATAESNIYMFSSKSNKHCATVGILIRA